ncbi:unnamed protein product [Arctia plantaginis]|uniref:Uncharacterized protein n=1 Tax=Arctia plantaginis TaxID=874455 RepID=A0A8S1AZ14_ARCPL|nr:unnamed protein product [Arctia plantaginis]
MNVLCLLVLSCVIGAYAGSLPSFFTPCSKSDPQLSECVQKVISVSGAKFTEGIPELGIAKLDPVQIGTVVVNNPSLQITFTDTIVTGLKDFRVNNYKINLEKGKATLDFTANVTLNAEYEMNGKLLILSIKGKGQAKIKITNLNIVVKYDFNESNDHWIITGYKDHFKMDRAYFKFNNLFNGNKQLAQTTEKFTNENWELIMNEIAPPAIKQIITKCVEVVNSIFKSAPLTELLLP